MRLLYCHIDNFGKLHEYTVNFDDNPTVLLKPNGWGKSTLAAFVKVMFYGFANEKKRGDALERERLRYKPWQGGAYGGELEFEVGGRRYRLNRTFGTKEAEDTFALYDAVTNLVSDDFTRNIGEELFQINQESFLRTVFLTQNDCATSTTDSINAKIGNLADNLDDMNQYEKVQQVLKDLRNSLTPSRKTGALRQRKDEMAELKDELRKKSAVENALAELEGWLADCRKEKDCLTESRMKLQEQWERAAKQKETAAKRRHYEEILDQCQEKQRAVDAAKAVFGGKVPDRALMEKMQEKRRLLIQRESEREAARLGDEDSRVLAGIKEEFADDMPGEEVLEQCRTLSVELGELQEQAAGNRMSEEEQQEIGRLKGRFAEWRDSGEAFEEALDQSLRQCELYSEKKSGLNTKRAALSSLRMVEENTRRTTRSKGRKTQMLLLILGGLLIAAGAVCLYFLSEHPLIGIIILITGAILATAGAVAGRSAKKKETREASGDGGAALLEQELVEDEEQIAQAQAIVEDFAGRLGLGPVDWETGSRRIREELYHLQNDWKRLQRLRAREQDYLAQDYEGRIARGQERCSELLAPYMNVEHMWSNKAWDGDIRSLLARLENDKKIFQRLSSQEKRYLEANQSCIELQAQLENFLQEHGQNDLGNADVCLQRMMETLTGYENDMEELRKLLDRKAEFEESYDVSSFAGVEHAAAGEHAAGAEEIREELARLDEGLDNLGEKIHSYLMQLDERQQELEELQHKREELSALEEAYERDYEYYCNLERTSEYLALAKESLSARYIGPVLGAFQHYYAVLNEEKDADFRMDTDIRVTRRESGEQRDIRAFSAGNRDLMYIALRVALVDVMYQGERPFLIMDDSFVNLDGERLTLAKRFLQEITQKYQVLYFTCHESRLA